MDSFDTKWGYLPKEIEEHHYFLIISATQFIVSSLILWMLQPPFIFIHDNDVYTPRISFVLIVILSTICTTVSIAMNENIHNLWNTFKSHK